MISNKPTSWQEQTHKIDYTNKVKTVALKFLNTSSFLTRGISWTDTGVLTSALTGGGGVGGWGGGGDSDGGELERTAEVERAPDPNTTAREELLPRDHGPPPHGGFDQEFPQSPVGPHASSSEPCCGGLRSKSV